MARAVLALSRSLGDSVVNTETERCEAYARDESEAVTVTPAAVIHARNAEDVKETLRVCDSAGVAVFPRAAGTGRTGGSAVLSPGVVLDMMALNQLMEIDRENLVAVVQPGMVTGRLHEAASREGLFYPPDPMSFDTCTLGGNAAENAGGPRAFKYGVTREYVLGLDAVLMGGTSVHTGRRTSKGVTGYDITATLVGSEGTLGVFTALTLRLIPEPPELGTLVATFREVISSGRAVSAVVAAGLVPRCIELLDGVCCRVLRESEPGAVGEGVGALLVIECDGRDPRALGEELERIAGVCMKSGAMEAVLARSEVEREAVWSVRRRMSRALRQRAKAKLSEDVVVPRTRVADLLATVAEISGRHGVLMPTYGHAGDGNLHVNFLWDTEDERPGVMSAVEELFRATISMGGTLSGEHGIGVLKAPYLSLEQSPELIELQRRVKTAFDPRGLLNPGKIFPRAGHGSC